MLFFVQGIVLAAVEALSETALLFYGWILLPPEISLLLMNGLFSVQVILNLIKLYHYGFTKYEIIADNLRPVWIPNKPKIWCSCLLLLIFLIGLLMQLGGLVLVPVFVSLNETNETSRRSGVMVHTGETTWPLGALVIVLCTLLLSFAWSDKIQRRVTIPNLNTLSEQFKKYAEKHKYEPTSRWKSSEFSLSIN